MEKLIIMLSLGLLTVYPESPSTSSSSSSAESGYVEAEMDVEERRRRNRLKQQKHYQQVKERRRECEMKLENVQSEIAQLRKMIDKFEQNIRFLRDRDCPFHTPGEVFDFVPPVFERTVVATDCAEPPSESPETPESRKRDKQRRFRKKVDNLERSIQLCFREVKELRGYLETMRTRRDHYQKMVSECWKGCNRIVLIEMNAKLNGC